jgi:hypothetical protein
MLPSPHHDVVLTGVKPLGCDRVPPLPDGLCRRPLVRSTAISKKLEPFGATDPEIDHAT